MTKLLFILIPMCITMETLSLPVRDKGNTKPHFPREKRHGKKVQNPWTINTGLCPPVLCGPEAAPVTDDTGKYDRVRPMASALVAHKAAVAYEPARGFPFFEGDIVLDREMSDRIAKAEQRERKQNAREKKQSRSSQKGKKRPRRSIVRPISRLWPYGIIPYTVDSMFASRTKELIEDALRNIANQTCITFVPRNTTTDKDYIFFVQQPGCWSFVGRRGGAQYVSLGRGCHYFGTAVHETTHAMGFWHEQSRLDRNDYVHLILDNVSPSAENQFGVRQMTESTSRGFAYDYESIMHYGTHYFSRNGKPTIKVIGAGKNLRMKVGQRKGLSEIDIAQLRDMYHCNDKDAEMRGCKAGWKLYKKSCYLFVKKSVHFGGAAQACLTEKAYPVHIDSQEEDEFLKRHLISFYPNSTVWRTGGLKSSDRWVWERRGTRNKRIRKEMNYTNWSPNHPGRYTTLTLNLFKGSPPRFVWRGAWAGSAKALPNNGYFYICEQKTRVECVKSQRNGKNYRGNLDYSHSGVTCQKWTSQYPHKHKYLRGKRQSNDLNQGLGDHNYCRNPDGRKKKPWCFTTKTGTKWEYCNVEICTPEPK